MIGWYLAWALAPLRRWLCRVEERVRTTGELAGLTNEEIDKELEHHEG